MGPMGPVWPGVKNTNHREYLWQLRSCFFLVPACKLGSRSNRLAVWEQWEISSLSSLLQEISMPLMSTSWLSWCRPLVALRHFIRASICPGGSAVLAHQRHYHIGGHRIARFSSHLLRFGRKPLAAGRFSNRFQDSSSHFHQNLNDGRAPLSFSTCLAEILRSSLLELALSLPWSQLSNWENLTTTRWSPQLTMACSSHPPICHLSTHLASKGLSLHLTVWRPCPWSPLLYWSDFMGVSHYFQPISRSERCSKNDRRHTDWPTVPWT